MFLSLKNIGSKEKPKKKCSDLTIEILFTKLDRAEFPILSHKLRLCLLQTEDQELPRKIIHQFA